jgi:hypothetical protein
MIVHAAWHIKVRPETVAHLSMPCGLCASYEQSQYSVTAGGEAAGCCIWLENETSHTKATPSRVPL